MAFTLTKQSNIFSECDKYIVKNEFLKQCMAFHNGFGNNVTGFAFQKGDGYLFLTFFIEQALGFRRYPFHADRVYSFINIREYPLDKFDFLSEDEVEEIIEEVKQIYNHTQAVLKAKGINSVNVTRAIGLDDPEHVKERHRNIKIEQMRREDFTQAANLFYAKKAAEFLNKDTIQCSLDTLNSFGENEYKGSIQLNLNVKASDIFYCHDLLDISPHHLERCEWVVINKHPKGFVDLHIDSIEVTKDKDFFEPDFNSSEEAAKYLEIPVYFNFPKNRKLFNRRISAFKKIEPPKKKSFWKSIFLID
ncbi:hypothetical protein [Acinetobacter gyllenbergii]|uniref:hypothetical protein n=1 Tax=Acinetobacter gyllenbergii TaxID=134534 RepID=UPI003F558C2C